MKCKSCAVETKVVDSRRKMDGVWRRRECAACKRRFNTMESVESEQPVVHKPKVVTPKVSKLRVVIRIAPDRFVGNLGAIAQMKPDVIDKFDSDAWADMYSDMLGVDPNLLVGDTDVAKLREQRAQAAQQQAQAEQLNQGADTAQKLGQVQTQNGQSNAANDVIGMFSGYQSR